MDDAVLQKRIQNVLEELEQMLRRTELIANKGGSYPAFSIIADNLTRIRVQLTELIKTGACVTRRQADALRELNAGYFRLEGRIKEIRNDSSVPDKSVCSKARARQAGIRNQPE